MSFPPQRYAQQKCTKIQFQNKIGNFQAPTLSSHICRHYTILNVAKYRRGVIRKIIVYLHKIIVWIHQTGFLFLFDDEVSEDPDHPEDDQPDDDDHPDMFDDDENCPVLWPLLIPSWDPIAFLIILSIMSPYFSCTLKKKYK